MSCNCTKTKLTEYDKQRKIAQELAKKEGETYIIYEFEEKLYFERLSCFRKAGSDGTIKEFIS